MLFDMKPGMSSEEGKNKTCNWAKENAKKYYEESCIQKPSETQLSPFTENALIFRSIFVAGALLVAVSVVILIRKKKLLKVENFRLVTLKYNIYKYRV